MRKQLAVLIIISGDKQRKLATRMISYLLS
jgi:hypothetical protein